MAKSLHRFLYLIGQAKERLNDTGLVKYAILTKRLLSKGKKQNKTKRKQKTKTTENKQTNKAVSTFDNDLEI